MLTSLLKLYKQMDRIIQNWNEADNVILQQVGNPEIRLILSLICMITDNKALNPESWHLLWSASVISVGSDFKTIEWQKARKAAGVASSRWFRHILLNPLAKAMSCSGPTPHVLYHLYQADIFYVYICISFWTHWCTKEVSDVIEMQNICC